MALLASVSMMTPSYAAYVQSTPLTRTVNGIEYSYVSQINTVDSRMFVSTGVSVVSGADAPIGYMGTQARGYNEAGVLKLSSGWTYNTSAARSKTTHLELEGLDLVGNYYYSKGQVKLYNGNGYTTLTCTATPCMTVSSTTALVSSIQENENGEIYGSEVFLAAIGVQPDLILAEGIDGTIGYVKSADLDTTEIGTPEQAMEYVANYSSYLIPLYSCDGETVIGSFLVK